MAAPARVPASVSLHALCISVGLPHQCPVLHPGSPIEKNTEGSLRSGLGMALINQGRIGPSLIRWVGIPEDAEAASTGLLGSRMQNQSLRASTGIELPFQL